MIQHSIRSETPTQHLEPSNGSTPLKMLVHKHFNEQPLPGNHHIK